MTSTTMLPPRAVLLHAAAVAVNGGALLFLAPPETGKSTMCQRLVPYAKPLVDDRAVIVPKRGEWFVSAADGHDFFTPLPDSALSEGVPLRAVFRLYRSPRPGIEALSAIQTCYYLVDAFFHFYWQKGCPVEEKRAAFSELASVARAVAGYRFYFNRSPKTVDELAHVISSDVLVQDFSYPG